MQTDVVCNKQKLKFTVFKANDKVRAFNFRKKSALFLFIFLLLQVISPLQRVLASTQPSFVKTASGDGLVSLTWEAVKDCTEYRIYRSTTNVSSTGILVKTVPETGDEQNFRVTNISQPNFSTYYYWLSANGGSGNGVKIGGGVGAPDGIAAEKSGSSYRVQPTKTPVIIYFTKSTDNVITVLDPENPSGYLDLMGDGGTMTTLDEALDYYLVYRDKQGNPVDTMLDSFILMPWSFYSRNPNDPNVPDVDKPSGPNWQHLIDEDYFSSTGVVKKFNDAVERNKATMGSRKAQLIFGLPWTQPLYVGDSNYSGPCQSLNEQSPPRTYTWQGAGGYANQNLCTVNGAKIALDYFLNRTYYKWSISSYVSNLEMAGFYWIEERLSKYPGTIDYESFKYVHDWLKNNVNLSNASDIHNYQNYGSLKHNLIISPSNNPTDATKINCPELKNTDGWYYAAVYLQSGNWVDLRYKKILDYKYGTYPHEDASEANHIPGYYGVNDAYRNAKNNNWGVNLEFTFGETQYDLGTDESTPLGEPLGNAYMDEMNTSHVGYYLSKAKSEGLGPNNPNGKASLFYDNAGILALMGNSPHDKYRHYYDETYAFLKSTLADKTAPTFSNISISNTGTSATITWDSSERTNMTLRYGLSTNYTETKSSPVYTSDHAVTIDNLTPGTTYHFKISGKDVSDNNGTSSDITLSTDTTAPTISAVTAASIDDRSAQITWTTNESATSQVEYGTTTSYGKVTNLDSSLGTSHSHVLNNLLPNTTYHYRVISADAAGNERVSTDRTFQTLNTPDTTPPTISSVSASGITSTSAEINWATNELSDSQVEYGITTGYGEQTALDAELETSHVYAISGLTPSTTYHYRIMSKDASNNLTTSEDFTFTTTAAPDETAPTLTGIGVSNITPNSAKVSWTTNELATTQIYYGISSTSEFSTTFYSGLTLSHYQTINGLTPSTTYKYVVKSKDSAGNLATSSERTFSTITEPDVTAPSTPTGFKLTTGDQTIRLDWTNPVASDFAGVKLLRKAAAYPSSYNDTSATVIYTGTGTTFTDTSLSNGTTYYYSLYSFDLSSNYSVGAKTNGIPAAPVVADTTPPANPSDLTVEPGNGLTNLSWNNPADSDFSEIVIVVNLTNFPTNHLDGSERSVGNVESFTDMSLINGKTYYYRVYAKDTAGNFSTGVNISAVPVGPTNYDVISPEEDFSENDTIIRFLDSLPTGSTGINISVIKGNSTVRPLNIDQVVSNIYDITAFNQDDTPITSGFSARITVVYETVANALSYKVYYWDGNNWSEEGITDVSFDSINNRVSFNTNHFSEFVVMAQIPASELPSNPGSGISNELLNAVRLPETGGNMLNLFFNLLFSLVIYSFIVRNYKTKFQN